MRHGAVPLLGLRLDRYECRNRHVAYERAIGVSTGAAAVQKARVNSWTSFFAGGAFVATVVTYLAVGLVCIHLAPEATTRLGQRTMPANTTCLRVTRHTNYATADITLGSPPRLLNVLLRLDVVKESDATALRLFSNRVAESASVACEGAICTDGALVHPSGPGSDQVQNVIQFEYTNPVTESSTYGTAVTIGLDGELTLKHGHDYYLTATHICWGPNGPIADSDPEYAFQASVRNGVLVANATLLSQNLVFKGSPASVAGTGDTCETGVQEVRLFPGAAGDEATWLGLASKRAYEVSPSGVKDRRTVVEVGTECAANHSAYQRANSLYELDCRNQYSSCENYPSLPYRRAASAQLMLHIGDDAEQSLVYASSDERLVSLPKLGDTGYAMGLSLLKLSLMTLAAAVTWIRAAKSMSSVDRLFMHCVRMTHCPGLLPRTLDAAVVFEDALIGLVAVGARLGVSAWRLSGLWDDGQGRAAIAQIVAAGLSLGQLLVRYLMLKRECETPLTKLGGSTALVDATCAVMMGFAEPPLLVGAIGRFDPTARLLTAMLVSTMTLQRCLFATACCGLLFATASEDVQKPVVVPPPLFIAPGEQPPRRGSGFDVAYVPIIFLGLGAWILQTASVAILMADVFCIPLAYSMTRSFACGWQEVAMAIFTATAAAGLPSLMLTLKNIAEDTVGKHEEKSQQGD